MAVVTDSIVSTVDAMVAINAGRTAVTNLTKQAIHAMLTIVTVIVLHIVAPGLYY